MSHELDAKSNKAQKKAREEILPQQRTFRRANRGGDNVAEWASANPDKVLTVIRAITERGCAVQFGLTRDGGALSVRIVGDGEPYTEYVRPTEDLDQYLIALAASFAK